MSDSNRGASDEEGPEDDGEYEIERHVTREEGATVLRRLAYGVANGSVELGDGEVIAAVPAQFELEIEYERDNEVAELEAELEWSVVDGEAVAAGRESEARKSGDIEMDDSGDDKEPADEEEPAVEAAADRPIDEIVGGDAASKAQFELYRDRANEWRWRLVHDNGNIIADSGEGYDRKATARNGLESVRRNAHGATVVETDN